MALRIPERMQSLALTAYGKPSTYQIMSLPVPTLVDSSSVLIRVHAASINPIDVKLASGMAKLFQSASFPYKVGFDVSGTVAASNSAAFPVGTAVYGRVSGATRGTASEYAVSSAALLARKPETLSHVEAASLPLVTTTALQALEKAEAIVPGGLRGKTVYVPAGLSGTGSVAVQLAKRVFGAAHVITTLSTTKMAMAGTLLGEGTVDRLIDYTKEDAGKVIPRGSVDFMFDTMDASMSSLHLMRKGGAILSISKLPSGSQLQSMMPESPGAAVWVMGLLDGIAKWRARRWGATYEYVESFPSGDHLEKLKTWVDEGKIKPVVGRTAHLEDLHAVRVGCTEVFEAKGGVGKFVIQVI